MRRNSELGLERFEARHPGLRQQVDAMFERFMPTRAISVAILEQYGERISHTTIWTYKRNCWNERRDRDLARKALMSAYREVASEERIKCAAKGR